MYFKKHERQGIVIVALADAELMGRKLQDSERVLDLESFSSFYKGTKVSVEEAQKELRNKQVNSLNLVGKRAVEVAVSLGLAQKEHVVHIQGIPHVQVYRL